MGGLGKTCADFRRSLALNRRAFVRAGMLGAAGLSLPELLRAEAAVAPAERNRENSVIILWMRGGPSQIDTWDPKPDAPAEIRGEFATVPTSVPGILLTDQLPLSGRIMHKWSIVRTLHHTDPNHSGGDQICFTGYPAGPDQEHNSLPSCGSIVARQLGHKNPGMPPYVIIPRMMPGNEPAYLGVAYKPFETLVDPANAGPFRLPNFALPAGLTFDRLGERRALRENLDRLRLLQDSGGQMQAMDRFHSQAWDILTSPAAQTAFDLEAEPAAVRERYGYAPAFKARMRAAGASPAWSQRVLLARRLVEAGVRLVTVDVRWWDTHEDNFYSLKNGFLPRWDQAYSALLDDLDERGLLKSTMVIAWGEFGRSPRINQEAGRDHYPLVFSAALAGGPIQGGRVVGRSDGQGALPADNPKTCADVLATMYRHLGVDVNQQYLSEAGRPMPVLASGEPIRELC